MKWGCIMAKEAIPLQDIKERDVALIGKLSLAFVYATLSLQILPEIIIGQSIRYFVKYSHSVCI